MQCYESCQCEDRNQSTQNAADTVQEQKKGDSRDQQPCRETESEGFPRQNPIYRKPNNMVFLLQGNFTSRTSKFGHCKMTGICNRLSYWNSGHCPMTNVCTMAHIRGCAVGARTVISMSLSSNVILRTLPSYKLYAAQINKAKVKIGRGCVKGCDVQFIVDLAAAR